MLIAYSTVPGYASLRDHDSGTWLIQTITDVFGENAKDTNLRDMLDMVSTVELCTFPLTFQTWYLVAYQHPNTIKGGA